MAEEMLFVYGTLRRAEGHPAGLRLAQEARDLGAATIQALLYDTGPWPCALPSDVPTRIVHGELFALPEALAPALLADLDEYEGCMPGDDAASLFVRRKIPCSPSVGSPLAPRADEEPATVQAWVYFFNRPVGSFRVIESGDWFDR